MGSAIKEKLIELSDEKYKKFAEKLLFFLELITYSWSQTSSIKLSEKYSKRELEGIFRHCS